MTPAWRDPGGPVDATASVARPASLLHRFLREDHGLRPHPWATSIHAIGVDFGATPGTTAALAVVDLAPGDVAAFPAPTAGRRIPVRLSPGKVQFCTAPGDADDPGYVVRGMLEDGHPLVYGGTVPDPSAVVEVHDVQAALTSRGLRVSAVRSASGLPVRTYALPLP